MRSVRGKVMKIPKLALKKKKTWKKHGLEIYFFTCEISVLFHCAREAGGEGLQNTPSPLQPAGSAAQARQPVLPGPALAPLWWVSQLCQPGLAGPHRKWEVEGYTSPPLDPFRSMPPAARSSWKPHTYSANTATCLVNYTGRILSGLAVLWGSSTGCHSSQW